MIKNILAVLLGLVVGNIAIMGLHYLGMVFYPLPEGVSMNDPEQLKSYLAIAPLGAFLFVMLAHLGGTFIAGISTALVSKNIVTTYIVGGFFTLAGIYNLYMLPHPMWFNIEAILYLPAAIYGFKLIAKK
jgi:hypothetical protein